MQRFSFMFHTVKGFEATLSFFSKGEDVSLGIWLAAVGPTLVKVMSPWVNSGFQNFKNV